MFQPASQQGQSGAPHLSYDVILPHQQMVILNVIFVVVLNSSDILFPFFVLIKMSY